MDTIIIVDSCSDLPYEYIKENKIPVVNFTFNFKGKEFTDDFGRSLTYESFYNEVRSGEMPTTSQVNSSYYIEVFEPFIKENISVIYLCFSSALSGSYNSALVAKQTLLEEYPEADLTIIDTKSASMGEGLIAYYAIEMLKKGASKDDIIEWIENNKLKVAHWFTVEDLNHLKRGGRISGSAAFFGSILDIKPILRVDDNGKLVPVEKVKGRKRSIKALFEKLENSIVNANEQVIFISHGDSPDDANTLAHLIRSKYPVKDIIINCIGPVIGAHSGPGTIAVFFLADKR